MRPATIPIIQRRKLRPREAQKLVQGHAFSMWSAGIPNSRTQIPILGSHWAVPRVGTLGWPVGGLSMPIVGGDHYCFIS